MGTFPWVTCFVGKEEVAEWILISLRDSITISSLSLYCCFLEAENLSVPCSLCSSLHTHYCQTQNTALLGHLVLCNMAFMVLWGFGTFLFFIVVSTEQSTCKMTPENLAFLPNVSLKHFLFHEILPPAGLAVDWALYHPPKTCLLGTCYEFSSELQGLLV